MQTRDLARMGTLFSAALVFVGAALMVTALVFDLEVLQAVFFGQPVEGGLSVLWERGLMRYGFAAAAFGAVAFAATTGTWGVLTLLRGDDDVYWWQRSKEAEDALKDAGTASPTALQIARAVLSLEEADDGWRPESMLRFLAELDPDTIAPEDRLLVKRLKADVRATQKTLDAAILADGTDTGVTLAGKDYTAIDLAGTLDAVLREARRAEGYTGTSPSATPVPMRRR